MSVEHRIRDAEVSLFDRYNLTADESFVSLHSPRDSSACPLGRLGARSRHAPRGESRRCGLGAVAERTDGAIARTSSSCPGMDCRTRCTIGRGSVRGHSIRLLDELFGSLGLDAPSVVGHSLGGMFALWHASARPGKIASLVAIGDPGATLPGVEVKMPLSILTVPGLGRAVLAAPIPRSMYLRLLGKGTSPAAVQSMPDELVDVLRMACRRKGNPRTVASLMHAIDGFRRPRPGTLMTNDELSRIEAPTSFYWGRDDPFLSPQRARPSVSKIPGAILREVDGGHAPWFENPADCAEQVDDAQRSVQGLNPD